MQKHEKGQVELEAILATVFSLVVLLIVIAYTIQQEQVVKDMEKLDREKNQCSKMATFISLMAASESNDSIVFESEFATTITGNTILVGNHYCTFSGQEQTAALTLGKIKIYKSNGVVLVENI